VSGQLHVPVTLPLGKEPQHPSDNRLCGSHSWPGYCEVQKNLFPLTGIKPWPSSPWPIAIPTKLLHLHKRVILAISFQVVPKNKKNKIMTIIMVFRRPESTVDYSVLRHLMCSRSDSLAVCTVALACWKHSNCNYLAAEWLKKIFIVSLTYHSEVCWKKYFASICLTPTAHHTPTSTPHNWARCLPKQLSSITARTNYPIHFLNAVPQEWGNVTYII
jgi:hypothetical protein